MSNSDNQLKKSLKQSQSMMTNSFNMGELLRNTTQLLAGNYEGSDSQNAALDLSLNENNVTRESVDNESCCSSLHLEEITESDEEDIADLDQMLLRLKSIGVKIKSVANNQANVINAVKKNSKKISDFKRKTARQFSEFTDLIVDRMDSCDQMRKAECEYKNLELEKNVKKVEAKINTLSEASEELHCLSGDLIAKKMVHEKRIKHLEDHQFVLENKLQKTQSSSSAASPWINKYPMPKFSGHKRERPMRFLKDFERYISATDINTDDFNYVVFACLEGIAREWWELVSSEQENIISFREKFTKKYWNENICFQISSELQFGKYIPNSNLTRVEYAIKTINNAKDLIPPPSEAEIVAKLSRHYNDDVRTAMIMRNIKTYDNLIELLDAFDQAGPSNLNNGNNGSKNFYNHTSFPNVYAQTHPSRGNDYRQRNNQIRVNPNNHQIMSNNVQQNINCDRGSGFSPNGYKNYPTSFAGNNSRFDRRDLSIPVHLGADRAHDNNGRAMKERNYNSRPNGYGYVQNGVYHRNNNVNTTYRGVDEFRQPRNGDSGAQRGNSGNANEGMRKMRMVTNVPRTAQGRSNENPNILSDGEPEISNMVNNVDVLDNQGN